MEAKRASCLQGKQKKITSVFNSFQYFFSRIKQRNIFERLKERKRKPRITYLANLTVKVTEHRQLLTSKKIREYSSPHDSILR